MKINIRGLRALSSPGCGDRNAREEGRQGKGCSRCVSLAQSHAAHLESGVLSPNCAGVSLASRGVPQAGSSS